MGSVGLKIHGISSIAVMMLVGRLGTKFQSFLSFKNATLTFVEMLMGSKAVLLGAMVMIQGSGHHYPLEIMVA